jgi:hypothetical protein
MPAEDISQPEAPKDSPAPGLSKTVPQADPGRSPSPDSHSLPTLGQVVSKSQERDWESSFKGLNDWVQKEFNPVRTQIAELTDAIKSLQKPQATPAAKPPAPVSDGKRPQKVDPLDEALAAKKAEQYRDLLLDEYAQATNLPLDQFRTLVPVKPVTRAEDGTLDDSAQRGEIQKLVDGLKGLSDSTREKTQEKMMQGYTPGSSPGGQPGSAAEEIYKEFTDLLSVIGTAEFEELTPTEKSRAEARYLELLRDPIVQEKHEGDTQPNMAYSELVRQFRVLQRQMNQSEGGLITPGMTLS